MRQKSGIRPDAYRDTVDTPFRSTELRTGVLATNDAPRVRRGLPRGVRADRRQRRQAGRHVNPARLPDGRMELRIAGTGGQGLLLAGRILADALTAGGRHVAQSQTYEPTSRGGYCNADLVVADGDIDYPLATALDALVLLDRLAVAPSWPLLKPGALVIADTRLCPELRTARRGRARAAPAADAHRDRTGQRAGGQHRRARRAGGAHEPVRPRRARAQGARRSAAQPGAPEPRRAGRRHRDGRRRR